MTFQKRLSLATALLMLAAGSICANETNQLGVLDLSANGGVNPHTGRQWEVGDNYRFIFSSSVVYPVDITSADTIATYNNWIQGLADASSLSIGAAQGLTWYALVSTPTVNVKANTSTDPASDGNDGPIMLMNGSTMIFTGYADIWGGSNGNQPSNVAFDENGDPWNNTDATIWGTPTYGGTWTGSDSSGNTLNPLATDANVNWGGSAWTDWNHWINRGNVDPTSDSALMYGLSAPLTIQGDNVIYNHTGTPTAWTTGDLIGRLVATSITVDVYVYWSTTDHPDSDAWLADGTASNAFVGNYVNPYELSITQQVANLSRGTTYYYAFMATNGPANIWSAHGNGTLTTLSAYYWDGGTSDIVVDGDGTSDGGAGSWNSSTNNWDAGIQPHVAWSSAEDAEAIFAGTAGTVTLEESITISNMTISEVTAANKYTIQGSALSFASGGSITVNSSQGGNYSDVSTISSAISNSPAVYLNMLGNTETIFAPQSGTMSLGALSGGGLIDLAGSTTGNTLASGNGNKIRISSGEWTLLGNAHAYQHFMDGGTLIVEGQLTSNNRDLKVSDGATIVANGTIGSGNANGLVFDGNTEGFSGSPGGTLKGTGVVDQTDTLNIRAEATVAPGYPTGTLTVTNCDCIIAGALEITVAGAQHSRLALNSSLNISNSTLNVNLLAHPGVEPVIVTYGSLSGEFAVTNVPGGWDVDYAYQGGNAIALIPPALGTVLVIK